MCEVRHTRAPCYTLTRVNQSNQKRNPTHDALIHPTRAINPRCPHPTRACFMSRLPAQSPHRRAKHTHLEVSLNSQTCATLLSASSMSAALLSWIMSLPTRFDVRQMAFPSRHSGASRTSLGYTIRCARQVVSWTRNTCFLFSSVPLLSNDLSHLCHVSARWPGFYLFQKVFLPPEPCCPCKNSRRN